MCSFSVFPFTVTNSGDSTHDDTWLLAALQDPECKDIVLLY